jgi:hypothetical protein
MLESEWQRTVIEAAQSLGWKVAHFRPGRVGDSWRTPVAADGAGFPDLVLVRDRVLFVELKSDNGKLSPPQQSWRFAIMDAALKSMGEPKVGDILPFSYHVWRPDDWHDVEFLLRRVTFQRDAGA